MLAAMGLRLSEEKTTTAHIDEGFEFLGFRIQRQRQARKLEQAVRLHLAFEEVVDFDPSEGEDDHQDGHEPAPVRNAPPLNQVLRGWTGYFRHARRRVGPSPTCSQFTWGRVIRWLRRKHRRDHLEGG